MHQNTGAVDTGRWFLTAGHLAPKSAPRKGANEPRDSARAQASAPAYADASDNTDNTDDAYDAGKAEEAELDSRGYAAARPSPSDEAFGLREGADASAGASGARAR